MEYTLYAHEGDDVTHIPQYQQSLHAYSPEQSPSCFLLLTTPFSLIPQTLSPTTPSTACPAHSTERSHSAKRQETRFKLTRRVHATAERSLPTHSAATDILCLLHAIANQHSSSHDRIITRAAIDGRMTEAPPALRPFSLIQLNVRVLELRASLPHPQRTRVGVVWLLARFLLMALPLWSL